MFDKKSKILMRAVAAHVRRKEILAFKTALSAHLAKHDQSKAEHAVDVGEDEYHVGHA